MTGKLNEKLDFYLRWLRNPRRVGAIAPTNIGMARKMVNAVRSNSELPVLELGPGTGAITRAILDQGVSPEKLISVEYCKGFLPGLRRRFPGVTFIHGDAFDIFRNDELDAGSTGCQRHSTCLRPGGGRMDAFRHRNFRLQLSLDPS